MARPDALERLASSSPSQLADARAHLTDLVLAARALATYTAHHAPDHAGLPCASSHCALRGIELGPEMCSLAHRLVQVDIAVPPHVGGVAAPELPQLVRRFRGAAIGALDAVRACRQTAHARNACWFASTSHRDGCADVLRLAHRL